MMSAALMLLAGIVMRGLALPLTAAPAQTGAPVRLTLRIAEGRSEFRPGEVIPLELEFGSDVRKRFVVDGATYDHSGRVTLDQFRVDPVEGVTDPMTAYFAANPGGMLGGLRTMGVLGDERFVVKLDLNEWVRFDRPGTFRLTVLSRRVTDEASAQHAIVPVESNTVSFQIFARDPAWEATQLNAALQVLDAPGPTLDRRKGCRMMRFLGTDAAVDEMVRRFGRETDLGCDGHYAIGLFAARSRVHAVRQMESGLAAPDQPVTPSYLRTLAALSVYENHPGIMLDLSHDRGSAASSPLIRGLIDNAVTMYSDILMEALPQKTDRARAIILAERGASRASAAGAATREQLASVFLELPPERQVSLLGDDWSALASPAMIPVLRRLVESSTKASAADLALRRLYELSPDQGRPLILREVQRPRPIMTLKTLGRLRDAELPDLDDVLAANFEASIDLEAAGEYEAAGIRAELVHRYASKRIADRLLQSTADRLTRMSCRSQHAMLAYFLRVDDRVGEGLLERALASRALTGCRTNLASIADLRMTPAVEARAIADLDDSDPDVVIGALATLRRHGSPASQAPLRAAFERWHARWDGRASELQYKHAADRTNARQAGVEDGFRQALGGARGWLMQGRDLRELNALCVTSGCRTQVKLMIDAAEDTTITILRVDEPADSMIRLAQYDCESIATLMEKLGQYPGGTTFELNASGLEARAADEVISKIRMFAAAQGIVVNLKP